MGLDRRGYPKAKTTTALKFKVAFEDQGYVCTEPNGSLKPGCRRLLYCPDCNAEECVFGGPTFKQIQAGVGVEKKKEKKPISHRRREAHSRASRLSVANKRAQGLTPRNKPLKETCWNCSRLRSDRGRFVCERSPMDKPVTKYAMRQRTAERMKCGSFLIRLVMEIPRLEW